nr:NUDIX hydrolase [Paracoccus binzhouensis]
MAVTLDGAGDAARVLLVQRRNPPDAGLWGFPGGHVEPGETGVIARPRAYVDNIDVIEHEPGGALRFHFLLAAVRCDYVSGVPVAADDALDARWVPVEEIRRAALPLSARVAETVARALRLEELGG